MPKTYVDLKGVIKFVCAAILSLVSFMFVMALAADFGLTVVGYLLPAYTTSIVPNVILTGPILLVLVATMLLRIHLVGIRQAVIALGVLVGGLVGSLLPLIFPIVLSVVLGIVFWGFALIFCLAGRC